MSDPGDRYIWHETIQTQHTRRSFVNEIDSGVLATVRAWLAAGDAFDLPGGYRCVLVQRSARCIEAEVYTPGGVRLIRIGVADHAHCGQMLWERIGGAADAKPAEPWCAASMDADGVIADPGAYQWLGDFERCLAWAWLESER